MQGFTNYTDILKGNRKRICLIFIDLSGVTAAAAPDLWPPLISAPLTWWANIPGFKKIISIQKKKKKKRQDVRAKTEANFTELRAEMDWSGKTEPERLFFSVNLRMSTILQPLEDWRSSSVLYMNISDRRKGRKVTKTPVLIKMSSSRWIIVNIRGLQTTGFCSGQSNSATTNSYSFMFTAKTSWWG